MSEFYPHRSALYMPGSNERALEKAKSLPADLFIFDMEDAVSPDNKERARDLILNVLSNEKADYRGKKILTRINSMDTVWANLDLECLQNSGTDGILFPKVSEVSDMLLINRRLGELNFKKPPEIWIMAETPKCVLNLGKILEEFSNIAGIVVGTNDLAKELILPKQTGRAGLLYALGSIILTAKAYNIITLDGVFNGISDEEGLCSEAEEGKSMGYDGKTLIHPNQIGITNAVFSPTEKEINLANKIIEAYEKAKEEKSGVTTVDGVLVEELHVKQSLALISKMKMIQSMS
ncbi:CoA ester lyase [Paracoccaceae bacterium]|nr:CoA ester lyase [Paracoccaceae bacterium]